MSLALQLRYLLGNDRNEDGMFLSLVIFVEDDDYQSVTLTYSAKETLSAPNRR